MFGHRLEVPYLSYIFLWSSNIGLLGFKMFTTEDFLDVFLNMERILDVGDEQFWDGWRGWADVGSATTREWVEFFHAEVLPVYWRYNVYGDAGHDLVVNSVKRYISGGHSPFFPGWSAIPVVTLESARAKRPMYEDNGEDTTSGSRPASNTRAKRRRFVCRNTPSIDCVGGSGGDISSPVLECNEDKDDSPSRDDGVSVASSSGTDASCESFDAMTRRLQDEGYSRDHIYAAIVSTSGLQHLRGVVLGSLAIGNGIPRNIVGVWTEDDDSALRGDDKVARARVISKHGADGPAGCDGRLHFLTELECEDDGKL